MLKAGAGLAALLFWSGSIAPAYAACAVCTAEIRLDPGLADCFLQRADDELRTLEASNKSFVIVDLRDCETRGGLPTGSPASGPPAPLDSRFVADGPALKCLSTTIAALGDNEMAPSHVFDLTKDCPAQ